MDASKRVLKAMGIFGGVQSVSIICSIVRAKLIAVFIGPAGVGLFAIFNTALDFISNTTQLNIRQSAVRDLSEAHPSRHPRLAGAVRWWASRLGLLGAVVMLAASPLLSWLSFADCSHWWQFALLAVAVLALSLASGEQAVMQGVGHLRSLARTGVAIAIIGIVLAAPLYYWLRIDSIIPSILLYAVVAAIVARAIQRQQAHDLPRRESVQIGLGFLKLGAYLTVSTMAVTAASYIFISYLNNVADTQQVGIYQAGYQLIVRYVSLVFAAIGAEYYPRLVKVASKRRAASAMVSHEISVLMCVLAFFVVLFLAFDQLAVTLLYSSAFLDVLPMLHVGILGAVFQGISYCIAFMILARGDGRTYVLTDVSSAAIGLALNITMYSAWGLSGLGWSFVLWYLIYAAMVWAVCRRRYALRVSPKAIAIMASTVAICLAAVALRAIAWWCVLAMLIPAILLAIKAKRWR